MEQTERAGGTKMSTEKNKHLISELIDKIWNQHDAAAIDQYFGRGLRGEVALGLLQQLGAISELQPVNWAGGNQPSSPATPAAVTGSPRQGLVPVLVIPSGRVGVGLVVDAVDAEFVGPERSSGSKA